MLLGTQERDFFPKDLTEKFKFMKAIGFECFEVDGKVLMRAGIEMLKTTIVTGVPASEYSDWNAVKLLYGDVFNSVLKNKAVPGEDFLADVQSKMEALKN